MKAPRLSTVSNKSSRFFESPFSRLRNLRSASKGSERNIKPYRNAELPSDFVSLDGNWKLRFALDCFAVAIVIVVNAPPVEFIITVEGAKATCAPGGNPDADIVTAPENPFTAPKEMLKDADSPA